mgnify:CR=1 FL=1
MVRVCVCDIVCVCLCARCTECVCCLWHEKEASHEGFVVRHFRVRDRKLRREGRAHWGARFRQQRNINLCVCFGEGVGQFRERVDERESAFESEREREREREKARERSRKRTDIHKFSLTHICTYTCTNTYTPLVPRCWRQRGALSRPFRPRPHGTQHRKRVFRYLLWAKAQQLVSPEKYAFFHSNVCLTPMTGFRDVCRFLTLSTRTNSETHDGPFAERSLSYLHCER